MCGLKEVSGVECGIVWAEKVSEDKVEVVQHRCEDGNGLWW